MKVEIRARRRGSFKFSRLCANLAKWSIASLPRTVGDRCRRRCHWFSVKSISCRKFYGRLQLIGTRGHGRPARRINIAAAIARRTSGQIVFAWMSARTPCFAVSYVFQADCQFSSPIRLRSGRSDSERNRFLVVPIKTSFGFRSKVGRTPPRLNSITLAAARSGSVACSYWSSSEARRWASLSIYGYWRLFASRSLCCSACEYVYARVTLRRLSGNK